MEPSVILFDVDGVLVQPGGYRAAVQATIDYFAGQMSLTAAAPSDADLAIFEAQGITCEWDMVPVALAHLLDCVVEQCGEAPPLDTLQAACDWLSQRRLDKGSALGEVSIEYAPFIRGLGRWVRAGEAPADTLLNLCQNGQAGLLFPHLTGHGVLRELLAHSRRPARSRTTHVFQTFVLGEEVFQNVLGLAPKVRSESLLDRYDRPLLLPELRERLLALRDQGRLRIAAYTARPSLPFQADDEPLAVYVPEAEMALSLVGMESIMLVGSGQMSEAALRLGQVEDRLTKPAPYHALAAAAAAWTGDRRAALEWTLSAYRYFEEGRPDTGFESMWRLPERLEMHIFEDSPSGMIGGQQAAEMLRGLGVAVDLHLWGITVHPEKAQALEAAGARIFPDVNAALSLAFASDLGSD